MIEETIPGGSIRWQCVEHEHHARGLADQCENPALVSPLYPAPVSEITEEMVERMARWLCTQEGLDPDYWDAADEHENWRHFIEDARAALRNLAAQEGK